jgi:hypothetical protein
VTCYTYKTQLVSHVRAPAPSSDSNDCRSTEAHRAAFGWPIKGLLDGPSRAFLMAHEMSLDHAEPGIYIPIAPTRDHLKESQKEVKQFGSKEPNLCQTGLHWTVCCAPDMSHAGLVNWQLSGFSWARWLKITGQSGVHRTCPSCHATNDSLGDAMVGSPATSARQWSGGVTGHSEGRWPIR